MKQKIFNFNFQKNYNYEDFFVSSSNSEAFDHIINNNLIKYIILKGSPKSGKTHLGLLWQKNNDAIRYNHSSYEDILNQKKNIFIDNLFTETNEEYLFHIINHCYNNNLNILICSELSILQYNFKIKDLSSRLNSFHLIEIKEPDDKLLNNLLMKLLYDKQIIIKNEEIFSYITKRINRTYLDIYKFVEKIDKLSLEKKRQLTIPLIKELL